MEQATVVVHAKGSAPHTFPRPGHFRTLCRDDPGMMSYVMVPGAPLHSLHTPTIGRITADPLNDPVTCDGCIEASRDACMVCCCELTGHNRGALSYGPKYICGECAGKELGRRSEASNAATLASLRARGGGTPTTVHRAWAANISKTLCGDRGDGDLVSSRMHDINCDQCRADVRCLPPAVHAPGTAANADHSACYSLCSAKSIIDGSRCRFYAGRPNSHAGEAFVTNDFAKNPVTCPDCITLMKKDPTWPVAAYAKGPCTLCGAMTARQAMGGLVCFDCVQKHLNDPETVEVMKRAQITSTYRTPEENAAQSKVADRHTSMADANPTEMYGVGEHLHVTIASPTDDALANVGKALIELAHLPRRFINTPGRKWLPPMSGNVVPPAADGRTAHVERNHKHGGGEPSKPLALKDVADFVPPYAYPRDEKPLLEELDDLLCD